MERLVIIDHSTHELYVEDVTEEMLSNYNGEEEAYIKDNYNFNSDDDFSWDYIVDAFYMSEEIDSEFLQIDFKKGTV